MDLHHFAVSQQCFNLTIIGSYERCGGFRQGFWPFRGQRRRIVLGEDVNELQAICSWPMKSDNRPVAASLSTASPRDPLLEQSVSKVCLARRESACRHLAGRIPKDR
jgi:hypothetical protein